MCLRLCGWEISVNVIYPFWGADLEELPTLSPRFLLPFYSWPVTAQTDIKSQGLKMVKPQSTRVPEQLCDAAPPPPAASWD